MSKIGSFLAHTYKGVIQQHHTEMVPLFRNFITSTSTIIDVGGHAGQFAKLFARMSPNGNIITFEPASYARLILRASIVANRIKNVTIVPAGLSDKCGCTTLNIPLKKGNSIGYGLSHMGEPTKNYKTMSEVVPIITLDEFLSSYSAHKIDFIKIDIEGWELRMLKGAEKTILNYRPTLLVELVDGHLNRAGDSLSSAWEYLEYLGYNPWSHDENGNLLPLSQPSNGDIWWVHGSSDFSR